MTADAHAPIPLGPDDPRPDGWPFTIPCVVDGADGGVMRVHRDHRPVFMYLCDRCGTIAYP